MPPLRFSGLGDACTAFYNEMRAQPFTAIGVVSVTELRAPDGIGGGSRRRIAPTAAAAAAEAAAAGIDTSRCERDPRCVRGWKHRGLGGRCSYNAVSRNGLSNGAPAAAISRQAGAA